MCPSPPRVSKWSDASTDRDARHLAEAGFCLLDCGGGKLIRHITATPNVWFATHEEAARYGKEHA